MKRLLAALVLAVVLMVSASAQWLRWPVAWANNMVISLAFGMLPTHVGERYWAPDFKHHDHFDGGQSHSWKSYYRLVLAPASKWVVWAGYNGWYGNSVMIDHGNGFTSLLAHLDSIWVWWGPVQAGWVVGLVGASGIPGGNNPHLHWELRRSNTRSSVDPRPHL